MSCKKKKKKIRNMLFGLMFKLDYAQVRKSDFCCIFLSFKLEKEDFILGHSGIAEIALLT